MKNVIAILMILLNISLFGQISPNLKWEKIDVVPISGEIISIIKSNDTLYAHSKHGKYWSINVGESWVNSKFGDAEQKVRTSNQSKVIISDIYYDKEKVYKSNGEETTYHSKSYRYKIVTGNGEKYFPKSYSYSRRENGHVNSLEYKDKDVFGGFKILNDNTLIYLNTTDSIKYSSITYKKGFSNFFFIKENGLQKKIRIKSLDTELFGMWSSPAFVFDHDYTISLATIQYIYRIIGHRDSTFISYDGKHYVELSEDLKITKKIKFPFNPSKILVAYQTIPHEEIFIIDIENGKRYSSKDRGKTWKTYSDEFAKYAKSYNIKDGLHCIQTSTEIFYSENFENFKFIGDTETIFDNIYVFGDTLLCPGTNLKTQFLQRSFDRGKSWEYIEYTGIKGLNRFSYLFQLDNAIFVTNKIDNNTYQQTDTGFGISPTIYSFRENDLHVSENNQTLYQTPLQNQWGYPIRKFDREKESWEYPIFVDSPFYSKYPMSRITFANNKIYFIANKMLFETNNDGEVLDTIDLPQFYQENDQNAIGEILISHDTIILNTILEKNKEQPLFISIDKGQSWNGMKGIDTLLTFGNAKGIIKNSNIYLINKKVWKYEDITTEPKVLFELPEAEFGKFSQNFDHIVFSQKNENSKLYLITNDDKIIQFTNPSSDISNDFYIIFDKKNQTIYANSWEDGFWKAPFSLCESNKVFVENTCDDLNPNTIQDQIQTDCSCKGSIIGDEYCRKNDSTILAKIYSKMNGEHWTNKTNWLSTKPLNEWYGILTNENGCVTGIDLDGIDDGIFSQSTGNNLSNSLPTDISGLYFLEKLNLSNNSISSTLSSDLIGEKLSYLALAYNHLSSISLDETKVYPFTYFNLAHNNIEGELNEVFGNMPNLEGLFLNHNYFSGCFPIAMESLCGLSQSTDYSTGININHNSRLPWFGDFSKFCSEDSQFEAPCNNKDEFFPNGQINTDCQCEEILSPVEPETNCGINDSLSLVKLYQALDIENYISNKPINLWSGVRVNRGNCVTQINLIGIDLKGDIPNELQDFHHLESINLSYNQFEGCFPDFLKENKYYYVNFGNNPKLPWQGDFYHIIEGEDQMGAFCDDGDVTSKNNSINSDCQCMGNIFSCRTQDSTILAQFYLDNDGEGSWNATNWVSDKPLSEWKGIYTDDYECVTRIYLHNKPLKKLPRNFHLLDSLKVLDLSRNSISDTIPRSFGKMSQLKTLFLSGNNLTGIIPKELEDLSLNQLFLYENMLTGTIPELNFESLQKLLLHDNNLEGCIPSNLLEKCSSLSYDLTNNLLLAFEGHVDSLCIGEPEIGAPCNDSNDLSLNDKINDICECAGTIVGTNNLLNDIAISIYPNPNKGFFLLEINAKKRSNIQIDITSSLGSIIYEKNISGKTVRKKIDLTSISSGIYFIQVSTKNNTETRKIIIE